MAGDGDERVFMIAAEDEYGDEHMVVTTNVDRLKLHHDRMVRAYGKVRGNDAFEEVRAAIGAGRS